MTEVDRDPSGRFFFVHIMKTAGTTLRRRLIDHFGAAAVYPTQGLDGSDPLRLYMSVDHLLRRLDERGSQIRVITGHFPLRTVELIDGRMATLTVLRDPVERMLSFLRQRQDSRAGSGRSLEEVYDGLHGLVDNNMTKMLSLTPAEMSDSLNSGLELERHHLELAKEGLAGMAAVGLQERFEDFCDLLSVRFGWRLGESRVVNATAPVDAAQGLRERIAEDNPLDVELYELARQIVASERGSRAPDVVRSG